MGAKRTGSNKRTAARGQRSGQRPGRSSPAPHGQTKPRLDKARARPLAVALLASAISAVLAIVGTVLVDNYVHQGAANEATVQGQQDAAAAAQSQDAELVDFGLGSAPHGGSPQIVIENRSSGWIRNLTLAIPVPVRETREADGGVGVSFPYFSIYSDGGNGFYGVHGTVNGGFVFSEPLPDIGPCELAVSTALRSFSHIDPATLAKSELYFTDPNGIAWERFGSGEVVRNARYQGPGVWSPYVILEPLPGCSPG